MKISSRGRYGLRAIFDLLCESNGKPVSIKSISQRQGISLLYLEQIFNKLKRAGLLVSERGAQGGFYLARDPDRITIGEIIRVLEGSTAPYFCVDGKVCSKMKGCASGVIFQKLNEKISEVLDTTTLADLKVELCK